MFNDRFLLTQAVLDGRKTQTRRLPSPRLIDKYNDLLEEFEMASSNTGMPCYITRIKDFLLDRSPYKLDEIVAIAQSYSSIIDYLQNTKNAYCVEHFEMNCLKSSEILYEADGGKHKGFSNKMFVKSELMPYQIKITNVRVQRLQDITDEECLLEGIEKEERTDGEYNYIFFDARRELYIRERTPRDAYARLIDMLSGKGTWDSNPYVFVFDFELIK